MKLITEITDRVETQVLKEETGTQSYYIVGPFLQAELKNRNGRVYPLGILQREVERYTRENIAESRALGELGHPDSPTINLDRVSHRIISLEQQGNDFVGKARVLSTPNGNIVKSLVDDGVKLGVSSRGLGTLQKTSAGNLVGEDFYLATAADIVADPSAPNAFVMGIMEGKEWVWQNGLLSEREVADLKRLVEGAPKKKTAEKRLVESLAFAKFLKAIRVSTTIGRK